MKKRICALLLVVVLLLCATLFAACKDDEEIIQGNENTLKQTLIDKFGLDESEQLTLNFYGDQENFPGMMMVISAFEETFPNCKISYSALEDAKTGTAVNLVYDTANTHLYLAGSDLGPHIITNVSAKSLEKAALLPADTGYEEGYVATDIDSYSIDFLDKANGFSEDGKTVLNINMDVCNYDKSENGRLNAIALAMNGRGMVVNNTLLEQHNLTVPKNWAEFLAACEVLKQAGLSPIQAKASLVGTSLIYPYIAGEMVHSPDATERLAKANAKELGSGNYFYSAFDKLVQLCIPENAYFSYEECKDITDEYESSIMNFFNGDVAFFPCTTETFSGMKKRETLESSNYDGFNYSFTGAPMSDGSYINFRPWAGLSVNPLANNCEWAKAFAYFVFQDENLNTISVEKGMPSVSKNGSDARFAEVLSYKAPFVTYASQFKISYYSQLGYTYGKIYELQPDVFGGVKNPGTDKEVTFTLGTYDTYATMAVRYYESKIKS